MSSHAFHQIYLHINWHVKDDRPTLQGEVEKLVHARIAERCRKSDGVYLHAVNGTETHVHLAISIEPQINISELIRDLKGGTSHDVNTELNQKQLYWQRGYGVVSFGKNNLDWVLEYIAHQKEHHARGSVHERLELAGASDPSEDV